MDKKIKKKREHNFKYCTLEESKASLSNTFSSANKPQQSKPDESYDKKLSNYKKNDYKDKNFHHNDNDKKSYGNEELSSKPNFIRKEKKYFLKKELLEDLLAKSKDFDEFFKLFNMQMPLNTRLDNTDNLNKLMILLFEALKILLQKDNQECFEIIADCFGSEKFIKAIPNELNFYQAQLISENKFKTVFSFICNIYQVFEYITRKSKVLINKIPIDEVSKSVKILAALRPNDDNLLKEMAKFNTLSENILIISIQNIKEKNEEKLITENFKNTSNIVINYKDQSVYPSESDCLTISEKPCYFKHIIKGPYPSLDVYLNNMFNLLKEDYMIGIRESFQALKQEKTKKEGNFNLKIFDNAYLYNNVSIKDVTFGETGIFLTIFLTPIFKSKSKKINWKSTKRMNYGSLLIICDEKLDKMLFSTVYEKPEGNQMNIDFKKYGNLQISIKTLGIIENSDLVNTIKEFNKNQLLVIESRTYFEAYQHFLKRIQNIKPDEFPFKDLIIKSKIEDLGVPDYLGSKYNNNDSDKYCFDLNFQEDLNIIKPKYDIHYSDKICFNLNFKEDLDKIKTPSNTLNILQSEWPENLRNTLDNSQYRALQNILTQNFSIIQGPPGTGKTYVGALAVKILLDNKDKWSTLYTNGTSRNKVCQKPLLIVAFTNHALDQFLNHISKYTKSIARIGGRCIDDNIKNYTLMELRKTISFHIENYRELKTTIDELEYIKNDLFQTKSLTYEEFIRNLSQNVIDKIDDDLASILDKFKVHFLKPLSRDSIETLYIYWRDWINLDEIMIYNIKKFEMNYKRNNLNTEYFNEIDDSDGETIPRGKQNNLQNIEFLKKNSVTNDHSSESSESEAELIEAWRYGPYRNKKFMKSNKNHKNIVKKNELLELIKKNKNPENQVDQSNLDCDDELSSENEDFELENNRKFENDLEENINLLEDLRFGNNKINVNFNKNDYEKFIQSTLFQNKNLWDFSHEDRMRLSNYCFFKNHEKSELNFELYLKDYQKYVKDVEESRIQRDLNILRNKDIVGMTVSGCAKFSNYLERLEAPITIIEEAAEVLETHTIAVLTKHTQHLIMIGDHQQLKPHIESYELEKKFNFNISLFERMINNGVKYVKLTNQRRMRPEFADFIRIIYEKDSYQDHESVCKYDNIKGVKLNCFFFNHKNLESENQGLKSKFNKFEAEMIVRFALYLTQQGYDYDKLTILSMYVGQTLAIKELLKKHDLTKIKVATIDNYQGEENDIILVSLVRSNKENKLGFVLNENRICVALSRAKMGMYLFGNFDSIYEGAESNQYKNNTGCELWIKIIDLAKEKNILIDKINLACQKHQQNLLIQEPDDFKNAPEGGCKKICNIKKDCGHICKLHCHNGEHKQEECIENCPNIFPCGHKCVKKCSSCINGCGKCIEWVDKTLDCGHTNKASCYLTSSEVKCTSPCSKLLPCGHQCELICSDPCNINSCIKITKKTLLCGHIQDAKCCENINELKCEEKCKVMLPCRHLCSGTCTKCFQGTLHTPCKSKCKKNFPFCDHPCEKYCSDPCGICEKKCKYRCCEGKCPRSCGQPCVICKNKCQFECNHSKCKKLCSDLCDKLPCNMSCEKLLKCGHLCLGLCGEKCISVCRECDPNNKIFEENDKKAKFYELECGHIFELSVLDECMDFNKKINEEKMVKLKECPICKEWIMRSNRYQDIIKKIFRNITSLKRKLIEPNMKIEEVIELIHEVSKKIETHEANENLCKKIKIELLKFTQKRKNQSIPKMTKHAYNNFNNLIRFFPFYEEILEFIKYLQNFEKSDEILAAFNLQVKNLGQYYLLNEEVDISDEQWEKIKKKLLVFKIYLDLRYLRIINKPLTPIINHGLDDIIKNHFDLPENLLDATQNFLKKIYSSKQELNVIIEVMNKTGEQLFVCQNEHFNFIKKECYPAITYGISDYETCPECKSKMGIVAERKSNVSWDLFMNQ